MTGRSSSRSDGDERLRELQPKTRRWPVVGLLGLTLLAISVLLYFDVPETEIELDAKVSEVGFTVRGPHVLSDALELAALGIAGARGIELPAGQLRGRAETSDSTPIRLVVASRNTRRGSITLAGVNVASATRVWLRATDVPQQFRLSIGRLDRPLPVNVRGPIRIEGAGFPSEIVDFPSPRPITVLPGAEVLDLDLTFPSDAPRMFSPQLKIQGLSLLTVEDFMEPQKPGARRLSTVLSGNLYFESLDGGQRTLRPGERLRFEKSEGEIQTLQLRDGHIVLAFQGRVNGMTTGSDDNPRSLMPTLLEWLRSRRSLVLLWGSTAYALGVALAILRWWRNPA